MKLHAKALQRPSSSIRGYVILAVLAYVLFFGTQNTNQGPSIISSERVEKPGPGISSSSKPPVVSETEKSSVTNGATDPVSRARRAAEKSPVMAGAQDPAPPAGGAARRNREAIAVDMPRRQRDNLEDGNDEEDGEEVTERTHPEGWRPAFRGIQKRPGFGHHPDGRLILANPTRNNVEQKLNAERKVAREKFFGRKCLPYVFYDKPIKTGSTAVTYAIREYIEKTGSINQRCASTMCTPRAESICNGTFNPVHLLGHIDGRAGLSECLQQKGYYAITSIRDPLDRWRSTFLFNRQMRGKQYGIPWNASFEYFLEKFPDCTLYHYYDQMNLRCDEAPISWEERLKQIVDRYDEVIDLYADDGGAGGIMFERIKKFLRNKNVSERDQGVKDSQAQAMARMIPEQRLYDELAKRRLRGTRPERFPC